MANKIQFRRGSTSERTAITLDPGEPGWDSTTKRLYVGDGIAAGGIAITGDVSSVNGQTGAVVLDAEDVGAAEEVHTHTLSEITDAGTAASKDFPASGDAISTEVVLGSDTRLTDDRTPLAHTHAQSDIDDLISDLSGKEPSITGGTSSQYWRGDKSWQTLNVAAVDGDWPTSRLSGTIDGGTFA